MDVVYVHYTHYHTFGFHDYMNYEFFFWQLHMIAIGKGAEGGRTTTTGDTAEKGGEIVRTIR